MIFQYDDGGRAAAGYKGSANDCVTRAIAIATRQSYQEIYDAINKLGASARNGVHKRTYNLKSLGWAWTPTMQIGSGCKVHLRANELPSGRLIVQVSKYLTAVIDGVIHDTHNPARVQGRCVYGYWRQA